MAARLGLPRLTRFAQARGIAEHSRQPSAIFALQPDERLPLGRSGIGPPNQHITVVRLMNDDWPAVAKRNNRRIAGCPARQFCQPADIAVQAEQFERWLGLMHGQALVITARQAGQHGRRKCHTEALRHLPNTCQQPIAYA